jgi:hypothetical protein
MAKIHDRIICLEKENVTISKRISELEHGMHSIVRYVTKKIKVKI